MAGGKRLATDSFQLRLQRDPGGTGAAGGDGFGDELHAAEAVVDGGEVVLFGPQRTAFDVSADGGDDAAVDSGEGFQISFRMAGGDAGAGLGRLREVTLAAREGLTRLAVTIDLQVV